MKKYSQKGFTLIELLVVVAIIAILALIVMLALNPVEMARRSRDSRRLSDMETLRKAIDLSLADGKTLQATDDDSIGGSTSCNAADNYIGGLDVCKYLAVLPKDPSYDEADDSNVQTVTSTCAADPDTYQRDNMAYHFESDGNVYVISAALESTDNCNAVKDDGLEDNFYELGTAPGLTVGAPIPTPT